MSTFLLEIGTEELPADFARLVLSQLREIVKRDLVQNRIGHGIIRCTSTPRRIVVFLEGLSNKADDSQLEKKGPPASQAFLNGEDTKRKSKNKQKMTRKKNTKKNDFPGR